MTEDVHDPERQAGLSARKVHIRHHADETALEAEKWVRRNAYYHERDLAYLRFLVGEGARS